LKRLLRRTGFEKLAFYYPEEGYRAVSAKIYPIISQDVVKNIRERLNKPRWLKLFSFLRLERALCNSYFVVAGK
jgi:hypothetical protein